jgi:hypothetical protein
MDMQYNKNNKDMLKIIGGEEVLAFFSLFFVLLL